MMTTTQQTQKPADDLALRAPRRATWIEPQTEEQTNASPEQPNTDTPTEKREALSQITPKVPHGEIAAGIPSGQILSYAAHQLDAQVDLAASTSNIDPAVVAKFKDEQRPKLKELAVAAEEEKREEALRLQTPTTTASEATNQVQQSSGSYETYFKEANRLSFRLSR